MLKVKDVFNPTIIDDKWIVGNKSCSYKKIKIIHIIMRILFSMNNAGFPVLIVSILNNTYNFHIILQIMLFIVLSVLGSVISLVMFTVVYNCYADKNN